MNNLVKALEIFYRYLLDWPQIIWFNFKYFPFKIAMKIPVFLHKTTISGGGSFKIDTLTIKTGMIRIGHRAVSHYPDNGCILENNGKIIFCGETRIGNCCAVSVGKKGLLVFGDSFCATAGIHIVCHNKVVFNRNNLIGWNSYVMDTNFHRLKDKSGNFVSSGYGEIVLGENNWVSSECKLLPNTYTPKFCSVACNSLLNKDYGNYGE
ncbi:MAG: hypothetical protein E7098_02395 [Mediterranea massiliensis]|nr:hypothetical protein [Mediterranea massiliensis]